MKVYHGLRTSRGETYVTIKENGDRPRPLLHRVRHSPTGFEWGYGGSGPADLAFSILWDLLGEMTANRFYQDFKWAFIAPAGRERIEISEEEVRTWIAKRLTEPDPPKDF